MELAPTIGGFLVAWWWLGRNLQGSGLAIFLSAFFAVYAAIFLWRRTS